VLLGLFLTFAVYTIPNDFVTQQEFQLAFCFTKHFVPQVRWFHRTKNNKLQHALNGNIYTVIFYGSNYSFDIDENDKTIKYIPTDVAVYDMIDLKKFADLLRQAKYTFKIDSQNFHDDFKLFSTKKDVYSTDREVWDDEDPCLTKLEEGFFVRETWKHIVFSNDTLQATVQIPKKCIKQPASRSQKIKGKYTYGPVDLPLLLILLTNGGYKSKRVNPLIKKDTMRIGYQVIDLMRTTRFDQLAYKSYIKIGLPVIYKKELCNHLLKILIIDIVRRIWSYLPKDYETCCVLPEISDSNKVKISQLPDKIMIKKQETYEKVKIDCYKNYFIQKVNYENTDCYMFYNKNTKKWIMSDQLNGQQIKLNNHFFKEEELTIFEGTFLKNDGKVRELIV